MNVFFELDYTPLVRESNTPYNTFMVLYLYVAAFKISIVTIVEQVGPQVGISKIRSTNVILIK